MLSDRDLRLREPSLLDIDGERRLLRRGEGLRLRLEEYRLLRFRLVSRLGDGERGSAEDNDALRAALPVPDLVASPFLSRDSILRCFLGGDRDLDLDLD